MGRALGGGGFRPADGSFVLQRSGRGAAARTGESQQQWIAERAEITGDVSSSTGGARRLRRALCARSVVLQSRDRLVEGAAGVLPALPGELHSGCRRGRAAG